MRMEQHALLDRKLWIAPNGFNEIRLSALERMAGTTRLELATSAVTGTLIWNFKDLRAHEGAQKCVKEQKGTPIVPALFPDSSVGIPKPMSGRIGTDVGRPARVRKEHSARKRLKTRDLLI